MSSIVVISHSLDFFFLLALVSENSVPSNPKGAQAFGKEFPASAHRAIQGENPPIRFPLGIICTQEDSNIRPRGSIPPRPRPLPLEPTPRDCHSLDFEGLSSKTCGLPRKHAEKDFHDVGKSYDAIEAKTGNPPIMPAVMTPGGPLDLSSVLFRNRIIFIGQPVTSQVAQRVISQLVTLATVDEDADILVYLNCPGGSTYSVLAIYDCMSWIKPKVGTVCFGVAASQGALLLAGGEKGMRYAMPNARIMIHQPQGGCGGHVEDVRRQVNEAVQSRHKIDKMYAAFTGQSLEKVQQYTERDRFLSVSEAMEFGLIDGVLETEY